MRLFKAIFLSLLCLSNSAFADDILPVTHGKMSFPFQQSNTTPPIPQGATVEFHAFDGTRAPRDFRFDGFVLGTLNQVIFIELHPSEAAVLARYHATHNIRILKTMDLDPDLVADRKAAASNAQPINVASSMRKLTVTANVAASLVATWQPGDMLIFPDAGPTRRFNWGKKLWTETAYTRNVLASFVAAEKISATQFKLTLFVDQTDALPLLGASAQNRLNVLDKTAEPPKARDKNRCYVRQRTRDGLRKVQIPCVN
jgi:hypothetical protein